jgi:BlaI family transcriptional regulator, penicillinase repressor
MARPRHENATPGELEVLKVLWDRGPSTVREVMEVLNQTRRRAYNSVMSLLEVMCDKRLVKRRAQNRAFVYWAAVNKEKTLGQMVSDLVRRGFEGSASSLVANLLDETPLSKEELNAIQRLIAQYQRMQE